MGADQRGARARAERDMSAGYARRIARLKQRVNAHGAGEIPRATSFGLVLAGGVLCVISAKPASVRLVVWFPIGGFMAPIGSKFGSRVDVPKKEARRRQPAKVARHHYPQ